MTLRTLLLGAFCCLLAMTAGSVAAAAAAGDEDPVRRLIAAAPGPQAYPGADAVVLRREVTLAVDDRGRLSRREHVVTRLQSQWAMRGLSDVRVAWDGERQDLQIHTCRTFMADGREVVSPPNAFNEVTPDAVDRAVPFLGVREMVISHVGTEVNAVLDLDYEVRDREPGPLPAWGEVYLQDRWPVREVTVVVSPAGLPAALLHGEGLVDHGDPQARRWAFRDLPALPGIAADSRGDVVPRIVCSSAGSWEELAAALRSAGDRATADLGPDLTAWLKDDDDLTPHDTLQRIAALAHDGVRAVSLPAGTWSRPPRPVAQVHASAVATPWEQALLTYALLRAAGFAPELGFFTRWRDLPAGLASAGELADLRVVTAAGGRNWWFAPTRPAAWPDACDLANRTGLFLETAGSVRTWKVPPATGTARLAVRIAPANDDDHLDTTADLEVTGVLRDGCGEAAAVAKALAASLGAGGEAIATTVREDTAKNLALRVTGRTGRPTPDASGLVFVALPRLDLGVLDRLPADLHSAEPSRALPVIFDAALSEDVQVEIELGSGQIVDAAPTSCEMTCAAGTYRLEITQDGDSLVIRRQLEVPAGRCAPADYPALRALIVQAQRQNDAVIILRAQ